MTTTVEATSLAPIALIAQTPPQNPEEPIESSGLPLVLYIARVPGSRDVFLTPVKPREKVVTAEDVQSSLYYVHVNSNGDYEPERAVPRASSVDMNASNPPSIVNRPPEVPPPLPVRRPAPSVSPPYPVHDDLVHVRAMPIAQRSQRIARKPVLSDVSNTSPARHHLGVNLPRIPHRPLPTPPSEESIHANNIRLLRHTEHRTDTNPYTCDYATHPETLKQLELDSRPEPGTLTLIRRDPSSSEQWNVATIHDPPVPEVSSSALLVNTSAKRAKKAGAPLYLDITNPGYSKFLSESDRSVSWDSISTGSTGSDPCPEGVFRRRLYVSGSRYAEHGYGSGHRKHLSVTSSGTDEIRKTMRDRHSIDLGSTGPPKTDQRAKGYTFASPWDGRCEFATGMSGKSLRCRHHLPNRGAAYDVSELRFNLPTSRNHAPPPLADKRSSYFSTHRRHLSSADGSDVPSIVVDEDGRIDLSLGQEKAGGGFGGKQAKLGKLIIEPDGLKMLDLLVAANLGLWWRAYERS